MKLDGSRSFAAPRETVWEVLNDPQRMAELMPGVERFDVRDDRHWVAQVKIPLGLGGLRMSINFDKLEERHPEYARLRAKGNGVGALMDMETQFHLDDVEGGTNMRWEADVKIAGPVGSMGQRVLQPIVNQQVSMVLNALDKQVQAAGGGERTVAPAASVTTESRGESAGEDGGESSGTAGAPEPSIDAPAYTTPEFYEGPEPSGTPLEPATEEGAREAERAGGSSNVGGDDVAHPSPGADPAEQEGTSGADEGISPWSPEGYDEDPEGPTTSTEDRP
jgi:carbon monoxide dehydrogenase subunit G